MPRDDKPDLSQWQPKELIAAARAWPLADFIRGCESAFLLIVMLQDGDSELSSGLTPGPASGSDKDGLAFRTATRALDAPRDLSATLGGDVVVRRRDSLQTGAFREQTSQRLPASLMRVNCHVVPICKRSEESFLHHVSLGRARNHDIVLRHRSVSKFHAWFEITGDSLFVKDCESRNHTFVNEERVPDRAHVQPGDTVRFGTVEARVCTAEGFWRMARG
jgi:hypothetical protein